MVKVACIGAVIVGLREHLLGRPLRYALLVLLRIRSEVDLTPPFKQKSMLYGGYDPVLPDAPYSTRRSTSALAPAFDQPIGHHSHTFLLVARRSVRLGPCGPPRDN
jgi:hypothetical protein